MVESTKSTSAMTKEERKEAMGESFLQGGDLMKVQDDFFYKISALTETEFKIEVPSTKKKYLVNFDLKSECGFTGLPFEWERYLKDMKIRPDEV